MEQTFQPLAERLRPKTLQDIVGQEHLTGDDGLIKALIQNKQLTSLILWGPAGTGKTTIARILANAWDADFIELSAVTAGIKDVREVIERAKANQRLAMRTVLFVDEVHRFNKSQQDAFLPHIESGLLVLIGATTENPSFEINNALLSRTRVVVLHQLSDEAMTTLVKRSAKAMNRSIDQKAVATLVQLVGGDGRHAVNTIELAVQLGANNKKLTSTDIKQALQRTHYQFDKAGDEHYNLVSALIKSMRGSDETASLYYLHRLLAGGEDPKFIARRLIIFASEDIGMAAPYAVSLAVSVFDAVHMVGLPEAEYTLTHGVLALARSPKSREVADSMSRAKQLVSQYPHAPVPLHIRNNSTQLMGELGYGKGYEWKPGFRPPEGFLPLEIK
jgi:putative ATPase